MKSTLQSRCSTTLASPVVCSFPGIGFRPLSPLLNWIWDTPPASLPLGDRGAPSHRRLQPPAPASSSRRRPSRPPKVQRPARKATAGHLCLGVARASGRDGAERPASTSAVGAVPAPTSPDPVTPGPDPRRVKALVAVGGLEWWWPALLPAASGPTRSDPASP